MQCCEAYFSSNWAAGRDIFAVPRVGVQSSGREKNSLSVDRSSVQGSSRVGEISAKAYENRLYGIPRCRPNLGIMLTSVLIFFKLVLRYFPYLSSLD